MQRKGIRAPVFPVVLGCVVQMTGAYFLGEQALFVAFVLTAALIVMWRGSESISGAATDVSAGVFIAAYPALLAGFAMLLLAAPDGAWRSFTFLCVTVASDVGGYAVGVLAGRHPMAPRISPKKTWEGFAGSVAAAAIAGILLSIFMIHQPWWFGFVFGAVIVATATIGDLTESLLKRDLGIKDISTWLPGHGGFLDRMDSIVLSSAAAYVLFLVFA